jgi:hypothetical protein
MDANSGEPWSEMEIADLAYSMACDGTIEDAVIFLCRHEDVGYCFGSGRANFHEV